MEDKKTLTIAIIAILISVGAPAVDRTYGDVFDTELENHYICSLTKDIKKFNGGISGTAYSGYPYVDSRKGAVRCGTTENKGEWISLTEYALSIGIDPYDLLISQVEKEINNTIPSGTKGKSYRCYAAPKGCELIS